ncbi:hypothetical protein AV530_012018 [Patagioenas fasciata monilis]|uniref:Uncharacterized protein n=1 Tax=Patagioenas fasciata monilis TaxID=372326 RepID=A0A1V4JUS8_PATFA|nr:hypothetical protein AV530_012018 [Patagioenas fasciata monilis]
MTKDRGIASTWSQLSLLEDIGAERSQHFPSCPREERCCPVTALAPKVDVVLPVQTDAQTSGEVDLDLLNFLFGRKNLHLPAAELSWSSLPPMR